MFQESDVALWVSQAIEKLDDYNVSFDAARVRKIESYDWMRRRRKSLPLDNVRSRLFRARMALKQLLEPVQDLT